MLATLFVGFTVSVCSVTAVSAGNAVKISLYLCAVRLLSVLATLCLGFTVFMCSVTAVNAGNSVFRRHLIVLYL